MENTQHLDIEQVKRPPLWSLALRYGLIGTLAWAIYQLLLFITNLQFETWIGYLGMFILVATLFAAIYNYRKGSDPSLLNWKEGFKVGMTTTLIYSVLTIVFFILYITVIDQNYMPNFRDVTTDRQIDKMVEQGLSEDQIETSLKFMEFMFKPAYMSIIAFLTSLLMGAIVSLIGGFIFQKKK